MHSHYGEQYGDSLKTKHRTTIWPSNASPSLTSRENQNLKGCMHPKVNCSTIYNSKDMKATWMSIYRGMLKEYVVLHVHNGILFCHEKDQNSAICRDIKRPRGCHTQWSKSEREKQILDNITYMWNLEKWYRWTYLWSRTRVTDVENKLKVTKEGREVGWIWRLGLTYIHYYV